MPNTSTLTLNNGVEDVLFQPAEVSPQTATFLEADTAKPLVDRVAVYVDQVKNKNLVKRNVRVTYPFVDGDGNRTFENATFSFTGLNTATTDQRKLALATLIAALGDQSVEDVIVNPEWFW